MKDGNKDQQGVTQRGDANVDPRTGRVIPAIEFAKVDDDEIEITVAEGEVHRHEEQSWDDDEDPEDIPDPVLLPTD